MGRKQKVKLSVDFLMLLTLLLLMAYSLVGETAHEVLGILMLGLWAGHQFLNRQWYQGLKKGKYNAVRLLMLVTNLAMLVLMLVQAVTGILLSRHLFVFLNSSINTGDSRLLHLVLPYWLFCLAALHLGFHGNMLLGVWGNKKSRRGKRIGGVVFSLLAIYGIYAFWQRQFLDYMFVQNEFAFFDFSEPLAYFFIDYITVFVLFAVLGYWLMKGLSGRPHMTR